MKSANSTQMSQEINEAIRWWNSNVSALPASHRPPKCSVPQATTYVFGRILPILALCVEPQKSDKEYWARLRSFISRFLNAPKVPDPISDFYGFLAFIYRNRQRLAPSTVESCVQFLFNISLIFGQSYVIYQAPTFVIDPNIYISAILKLRDINHPFWEKIIGGSYDLETFYGMYAQYYMAGGKTTDPASWNFRLSIAELVSEMTVASLGCSPDAEGYLETYQNNTIDMIKSAPPCYGITLIRQYISVLKHILLKANDDMADRAYRLLYAASKHDACYYYVLRFFMFQKPKLVRGFKILKLVTLTGVRNVHDLEIMTALAEASSPGQALISLGWNMIQSKIWHRACLTLITQIAIKYDRDPEVREWLTQFIKLLFMFVGLTVLRGRYEERAVLICESLARIMHGGLPWMRRHVMLCAASAWASGATPGYYENFFPVVRETDPTYSDEYSNLLMMDIDLKSFPFVAGTLKLVDVTPKTKRKKLPSVPKTLKGGKPAKKSTAKKRQEFKKKVGSKKTRTARTIG